LLNSLIACDYFGTGLPKYWQSIDLLWFHAGVPESLPALMLLYSAFVNTETSKYGGLEIDVAGAVHFVSFMSGK
jgi:hypothetical protein